MSVNNELFERDADEWWSDNSHCALLHSMIPVRLYYLCNLFAEHFGIDVNQVKVLDIGCGGGLFTEEVARLGCKITGVDLSSRSIKVAQQHAKQEGLTITYRVAPGEQLPFKENAFDLVYCCDVLEHVDDINSVIAESARVLKAGGVYMYDTINRTWLSKILVIKLLQEWEWARVIPQDLHDWKKFVKPKELEHILALHGLEPREIIGLVPDMDPISSLKRLFAMRKVKRGVMSYAELGHGMMFRPSRFRLMNYMGYAVKSLCRATGANGQKE